MAAKLTELLSAEPDRAKALVPELRLFHPREIASWLEKEFQTADSARAKARCVWAAGELGGRFSLAFLAGIADSPESELRRLSASALGKAARAIRAEDQSLSEALESARQALLALQNDPAPQVRQYAEKALLEFPSAATKLSGNKS